MKKLFSLSTLLVATFTLYAQSFHQHFGKHTCNSLKLPAPFKSQQVEPELENERQSNAYTIPFDTIQYNSLLGNQAFDLVICVDGAVNSLQVAKADRYIDSLIKSLKKLQHYEPRYKFFNVYRIAKYSNETGAALGYNGDSVVDNRYGSRFNAFGLSRLLVPDKHDTLFADVDELVPIADFVMVLVFDKKYGGSGWRSDAGRSAAMFTIDEESGWYQSDEVALHEMQHLMPFNGHGYLGDEYEDSLACLIYDSIPPSPNVTGDTIGNRKWEHCLGIAGVGFYPNAGICAGNYKPTTSCLMQTVFGLPQLCAVCRENSTAWLDSMINPIYYISAVPDSFKGNYTFSVLVDTPLVNTFRHQWLMDDSLIQSGSTVLNVDFDLVDKGKNHLLKYVCTDIDAHIIDTTLRRPWVKEWQLNTYEPAGIAGLLAGVNFEMFPNPVNDILTLHLSAGKTDKMIFEVTDLTGKVLKHKSVDMTRTSVDVSDLAKGIYIVTIQSNEGRAQKKLVVE
jgi:hypothetical protein